jgi:hypothetical protein
MTLVDFLRMLTGPAIGAAVGILLSILADYVPRFNALDPKWKRLVMFGFCIVVPCVGVGGLVLLGAEPSTVESWWQGVLAGVTAFAASTLRHTPQLTGDVK